MFLTKVKVLVAVGGLLVAALGFQTWRLANVQEQAAVHRAEAEQAHAALDYLAARHEFVGEVLKEFEIERQEQEAERRVVEGEIRNEDQESSTVDSNRIGRALDWLRANPDTN